MNYQSPILNKLTDNILNEIFRCLHLNDLCSVADVCKRFKQNAVDVFTLRYKDLDILKLIGNDNDFHDDFFMVHWLTEEFVKRVERLLRNFGVHIKALQLTGHGEMGGMDENELLLLVKTHCRSLKELTLRYVGNEDNFDRTELLPMFAGLEVLSLFGVFGVKFCDSFVALLENCHELKSLKVDGVPASMWMSHEFPKLDTLDVSNSWEFEYTEFESFLEKHENLRTFRCANCDVYPDFFSILSKASPRLQTVMCVIGNHYIDYDDWEQEVLQLSKLKSLRNLTFSDGSNALLNLLVDGIVKEDSSIKSIEILESRIDNEFVVGVAKLKWIETLKLTRCELTKEAITNVNKILSRLNTVTIEDIDVVEFNGRKIPLGDNVSVVNSTRNPILKQVIQSEDPTNILNVLHDDCLTAVFQYLPLPDLCNVADVCKIFKRNAQKSFQLHHASLNTKIIPTTDDGMHTDMQMAEKLFRNFGYFMRELYVQGRRLKNMMEHESIMYLATKYCISMEFNTLTLDDVHISSDMRWIVPLLDMFHILPKLELRSCYLSENFVKLIACSQIRTVQMFAPRGEAEWMRYRFRNLRTLLLSDIRQEDGPFEEFIKLNRHLEELVIHGSTFSPNILKVIAEHMGDRKMQKNVQDDESSNDEESSVEMNEEDRDEEESNSMVNDSDDDTINMDID